MSILNGNSLIIKVSKPDSSLTFLLLFVFDHDLRLFKNKLDYESLKCVQFVGHFSSHKGYKCDHRKTNKIFVSIDVITFFENLSYCFSLKIVVLF